MGATAVVIDVREPDWVQALTFGGLPTTVSLLDYGDIWVSTDDGQMLAIERKEPSDFLNTLREDRLFPQMCGLRNVSPYAYLLITGQMLRNPQDGKVIVERGVTGWSWAAVQGALLTVQEMGVMVTYAANDQDLEAAVLRLAGRRRDTDLPLPPRKNGHVLTPGESALAALPGIGVEKTIALLDFYGVPAVALAALTQLWTGETCPGIGEGIKNKVRQALGLEESFELAVMPRPNYKPPEIGGTRNV